MTILKYEKVLKSNGLSFNPFEIKTHNENDNLNIEKTIFNKCSFSHTLIISGLFDEVNDTIISQNYVVNCFRHSSSKNYSYRIDNLIDDIDSKLKTHDVVYSKDKTDEIINLLKLIYY